MGSRPWSSVSLLIEKDGEQQIRYQLWPGGASGKNWKIETNGNKSRQNQVFENFVCHDKRNEESENRCDM